MPPRAKKSVSPARSRSGSRVSSRRTSTVKPAVAEDTASQNSAPRPDPAAVQRLIDEAMSRAAARRALSPAGRAAAAHSPKVSNKGVIARVSDRLFPDTARVYSPATTARLTDLIGVFLVTCLTIYFTIAGYLFYREVALNK